jgi:hypothetical protein
MDFKNAKSSWTRGASRIAAVTETLACLTCFAGAAASAAACSGSPPKPAPKLEWTKAEPTTTPVAPTTPVPARTSEACAGCSPRTLSVMPMAPDPEARTLFLQGLGQPAVAITKAADPPRVTEAALHNTALGAAFGMQPSGDVQIALLHEGERASRPVAIAVGECATFVAQGGLGSVEVDMFLTAPGSPVPSVLAQDQDVGSIAVLGGRGECIRSPTGAAFTGELHVRMRRGEGVVLVRSYRR